MSVAAPRRLVLALIVAATLSASGCTMMASDRATVVPTDPGRTSTAPTPTASPSRSAFPDASPSPTDAPTTAPTTEGVTDCGGAPVTLSGADLDFVLTGDCPSVTVNGTGNDIDTERATVGALQLGGDRNELDATGIQSLTLGGQENDVDADSIQRLTLNGDRNEVEVRTGLGAVTVSGNDNVVTAAQLGSVTDNGQRNRIAAS
jgi:hypothetical protein